MQVARVCGTEPKSTILEREVALESKTFFRTLATFSYTIT